MTSIYVSTDSAEAEALLGNGNVYSSKDFNVREGMRLAKAVGFNPMSRIEVDGNIGDVVSKLMEHDLVVAVDNGVDINKYVSEDYHFKTQLLKISHYKQRPFADCIFSYTVNPNRVDPGHGIPTRTGDWEFPWDLRFPRND